MTSTPEPDDRLIGAHDLAVAALKEITPASTIGPPAGYLLEDDGSVSLRFENRLPGYPGWYWTVTLARVEDAEPTVLEVELLPNEGALLAPEWVPWAERLAEYRAHQAELAEQAAAAEADSEEDESDEDQDDDDLDDDEDDDAPESRVLHAGDLDGVDIDELDDSAEDSDEDEPESESDEDESESDEDESDEDESDEDESDEDESDEDESDEDE